MAWPFAAIFAGVAGVAVVATIIVIYVTNKAKQQKSLKYSSDNSVRCNGVDYRYDPATKTIVESSAPVSNDSNNNLKKRSPIDKKSPGKSVVQSSEKSTDKKNTSNVSKEVQTDSVDVIQNNLDKPMSLEEKIEYFRKNIRSPDPVSNFESPNPVDAETLSSPDSSEWSNMSSEKSTDSTRKHYKKRVHKSFKKFVNNFMEANCERHFAENTDENSDTLSESDNLSSASSSRSNISSEKSTDDFERAYKKKMHKTLRKFIKNMKKTETTTAGAPSEYSDETSSILSRDLKNCMACEKNPVNTRTQPCNHRYMCSDCAIKFFRLKKTCKVCRSRIEQYVVED